jgi:hypothetical protein
MNRELSSLQSQRSDILQKMADIKKNLPQEEDYEPVAGTSTDTENTSKEFTYEDMAV